MCTDTQTDAFGPVSTTLQAELAKEVTDLRDQLATAHSQTRQVRAELNQLFEAFQEALLGVEDEDTQEAIKDFLEEVTGREFHVTKAFRVEYRVVVTFRARNQEAAEEVGIDVNMAYQAVGDEIDDFEVEEAEQVSCDED